MRKAAIYLRVSTTDQSTATRNASCEPSPSGWDARSRSTKVDVAIETAIRTALAKRDRGMRKIAADIGVGVGTVQRIAAELKAA